MGIKLKVFLGVLTVVFTLSLSVIAVFQNRTSENGSSVSHELKDSSTKVEYVGSDGYKLVKHDNGLYGVLDRDDNEIISPRWSNIQFISPKCFVVSKNDNGVDKVGIIDNDENILVPTIYSSIEKITPHTLLARIDLDDISRFVLFDSDGFISFSHELENCSVSGENLILKGENDEYIATDTSGKLEILSLKLSRELAGISFDIEIDNPPANLDCDVYDSITKITIDYITALLSHDVSVIRNLTNSEYYNSLISNNVLNGAEIMHIISMTPVVEDSELGFSYGSRTVLVYSADGGITRNQLTLNLKMFKNEDGSFVLSDMDKTIVDSISAVSETTE